MKYLCLLLIILPKAAFAEPGHAADYLINEPLTMMDYGLVKLKKYLESVAINDVDIITTPKADATFSWKDNEIHLKYYFYPRYEILKNKNLNSLCRDAINQIRNSFGYGNFRGEEEQAIYRELGGVPTYFRHSGFASKAQTDKIEQGIEEITRITVSANTSEKNQAPLRIHSQCTLKLTDGKIYFEDNAKN